MFRESMTSKWVVEFVDKAPLSLKEAFVKSPRIHCIAEGI